MNEFFTKLPLREINGVLDYLGSEARVENDYIDNYENISEDMDHYSSHPSVEIEVISNCCKLSVDTLRLSNDIDNIIDIGCGFGNILNQITKSNLTVGVDISINGLNNLSDEIIKIRSFAEEIPIKSELFDLAICTDVFEHVLDEKILAKEISRILKPGGFFIFACPWEQDLTVYDLKEYKERFTDYKYKHLRSVDMKTIESSFPNFEVISTTDIVSHMKDMLFEPYSIKFFIFRKMSKL